ELGGDLPLRQAARKQAQDLELTLRELPERCARAVSLACGTDPEALLGPLEATEPVARVGKRLEEVADTRQETPGCGRLALSLSNLGERKRGVDDHLPRSQSLPEGESPLDLFRCRCEIAAPAEQRALHDLGDRHPGVLLQLGTVHQLGGLARKRLGRPVILLV